MPTTDFSVIPVFHCIGEGTMEVSEITETVQLESVDVKKIKEAQESCTETNAAIKGNHHKNVSFQHITINGHKILCELSLKQPRPLIPTSLRHDIIQKLHSIGHPGEKETNYRVTNNFYWNKMKKDVEEYCKKCHQCLSVKPNKQKKPHIGKFKVPDDRFSHLVVDIIEMPRVVSSFFQMLLMN